VWEAHVSGPRGGSHPMGSFRPTGESTTLNEIRHTRFGDREASVLESIGYVTRAASDKHTSTASISQLECSS